jgi:hypothetical protein
LMLPNLRYVALIDEDLKLRAEQLTFLKALVFPNVILKKGDRVDIFGKIMLCKTFTQKHLLKQIIAF